MEGLDYTLEAQVHRGWQLAFYFAFFLLGVAWTAMLLSIHDGDWTVFAGYCVFAMLGLVLGILLLRRLDRRAALLDEAEVRDLLSKPPAFAITLIGLLTETSAAKTGSDDVNTIAKRADSLLDGEDGERAISLFLRGQGQLIDDVLGSSDDVTHRELLIHAVTVARSWEAVNRQSVLDEDPLPVPRQYAGWRERFLPNPEPRPTPRSLSPPLGSASRRGRRLTH